MDAGLAVILGLSCGASAALLFLYSRKTKQVRELTQEVRDARERLDNRSETADREKNRIPAIVESMVEGLIVIDTDQRIVLLNSALARAFGLQKEQAIGKHFWEVFRDSALNDMIGKGLGEKISFRNEHAVNLIQSVFEIQISPIFTGESFMGVVAVFHDVTRLKQLEKMRSEFVANVSHELKTPLTSILGFVETLKEGAVEDPKNRDKFLKIIEEHSQNLNHLIEELLLLSKVESGDDRIKKKKTDLEKMILRLVGSFQKAAEARRIRIFTEVSPKPFEAEVSPKIFEQALSNLIDNAIKYNCDAGEIHIKAFERDGKIAIEIRDTGIGIPEEDLPRIFERFYRVDKSRSRESGGTGLGLSIVKHIVERHGGEIQVSCPASKGSSFTVLLPKA